MIPFLAYVQIAGMNPFEDQDPEDEGSYANASLAGRITTNMLIGTAVCQTPAIFAMVVALILLFKHPLPAAVAPTWAAAWRTAHADAGAAAHGRHGRAAR